jgi:hypothetical protein
VASTLLNHSFITTNLSPQVSLANRVTSLGTRFILSETNLAGRNGTPGVSDTFASALWTVDYSLWAAAHNVSRIHMHQGADFAGSSWQPVSTRTRSKATLPNYYGNIAVAAMVGRSSTTTGKTQIVPLQGYMPHQVAYAAYESSRLKRIMVLNTRPFASSAQTPRPTAQFYFAAPLECAGKASVARLLASGSDAAEGVSWNGLSYGVGEGDDGRARRVPGVEVNEVVEVGRFGSFGLVMEDSSAAMVSLDCAVGGA